MRRHSEQLQLVAVSGAAGSVRRTKPQWQEPCSEGGFCSWLIKMRRRLLCHVTPELSRLAEAKSWQAFYATLLLERSKFGLNELLDARPICRGLGFFWFRYRQILCRLDKQRL